MSLWKPPARSESHSQIGTEDSWIAQIFLFAAAQVDVSIGGYSLQHFSTAKWLGSEQDEERPA
jgi:hypothetical protein